MWRTRYDDGGPTVGNERNNIERNERHNIERDRVWIWTSYSAAKWVSH